MRKILFLLFTNFSLAGFAQSDASVKLPQVLPPTPEAAAIIRAGQLSVGMHSGTAQASIPIHKLTAGALSFPISLNYAGNGLKVDAIPGRLGVDWSMNTGVVTRTVRGIPDEKATHPAMPANLYANTQQVLDYYEYISSGGNYEGEPDEFNYNAPGISGKFLLDYSTGQPRHLTYSQDKINVVRNLVAQEITQIIITSSSGNKYFFGNTGATEHTITHNVKGAFLQRQDIKTAFFLYRMEDVYGNYIDLNYQPVTVTTKPGIVMSVSRSTGMMNPGENPCGINQSCPSTSYTSGGMDTSVVSIQYSTVYLTSIVSSTGQSVYFQYVARQDQSGDKQLTKINIYNNSYMLNTVTLNYVYPTPAYVGVWYGHWSGSTIAQYNKRFFLTGIKVYGSVESGQSLDYSFNYHKLDSLPYRLHYSQDYFGFYNGKYNVNLMPPPPAVAEADWIGAYGLSNRYPDGNYAMRGMLTGIAYPTGGTESFEYESNTIPIYGENKEAGGVRVKKIKTYDPVTQKENAHYFRYNTLTDPNVSTGIAALNVYGSYPFAANSVTATGLSNWCENATEPLNCGKSTYMINSASTLYLFDNKHIGYTCVTESDDPSYAHGATEHYFFTEMQGQLSTAIRGNLIGSAPYATVVTMDGVEHRTHTVNSSLQTVNDAEHVFNYDSRVFDTYYAVIGSKKWMYAPSDPSRFDAFDITLYQYQVFWPHLDKTTVKQYDPATGQMMQTVTDYYYDQLYHLQPNRVVTTNSDGETLKTEKKFASDLTGESYPAHLHPWQAMVTANILDPVIEERAYRNTSPNTNVPVGYTRNEMVRFMSGVKPAFMNLQKGTGNVETRVRYHKYSVEGNVLEMSKENDSRVSFIWDYNHQQPVAEAVNASWNDIAYTSFEADGTGNWSVPGSVYTGGGFTGTKAYYLSQGSITNNEIDPAKDLAYLVQCWVDNPGNITVNGTSGTLLLTKGSWKLLEFRLVDPSSITISGTALVDELRMFPENAQIKTVTYHPNGINVATENDARNNVISYEYDKFNRLLLIRDIDKNIIKQLEYKYGQPIAPCSNTSANWVATGTTRCQKDASNCNTGNREHEEMDMNNCSTTYLTTRWVSDGASANCVACTSSNCTGADKKCINCVCETGLKVYTSSVYNRTTHLYTCTYYYLWSNGSQSQSYTEQSSTSCPVGVY